MTAEQDPGALLHALITARVAKGVDREVARAETFAQYPALAQAWNTGTMIPAAAPLLHPANRPLHVPSRLHLPPLSQLRRLAAGEEPPAGATLLHKLSDESCGGGLFVMAEAA